MTMTLRYLIRIHGALLVVARFIMPPGRRMSV